MRFLFGASAIMLMLFFNYIEISSAMNHSGNKRKTLNLFSETPESLGTKSGKNGTLRMVNNKGTLRAFDDRTGKFVEDVRIASQGTRRLDPLPKVTWSMQLDVKRIMRVFNHDTGRFEDDPQPYERGTAEYNLALAIQKAHHQESLLQKFQHQESYHQEPYHQEFNRKDPLPKVTWTLRTDANGNRRTYDYAAKRYADEEEKPAYSNTALGSNPLAKKEKRGLLPKISVAEGYKANLKNQPEYHPYVNTPRPGQASVTGHDPHRLNQGEHRVYQDTPRLPLKAQTSAQFSPYPYFQGPSRPHGSGYQQ